MFTSGTTSTSKGVMLTDENIINNILGNDDCLNISNDESILIIRPLVHISALVGELLFALYKGLTIHFYEDTLVPRKINQYINENDKVLIVDDFLANGCALCGLIAIVESMDASTGTVNFRK